MSIAKENAKMVGKLAIVALGMFAFGYVLIPIYKHICELTGINILSLSEKQVPGAGVAGRDVKLPPNSQIDTSRTITVDDNIRITLNGAVFSPKDAKGRDVPLFSYNGTTYAPVRAICEAAGLKVDFDSANYTAVLTTPDRYIASTPSASNYISVDKAKEIALNHAGVKAADAIFVKAGLDWDDGRTEYEVEFYAGNTEYDYSIDATTGAIRSYDHDWDDFSLWNPGNNAANPSTPGTSTNNLISEAKAKEIALAKAPSGASVVRCHLDWDDGRYIYEIKMVSGTMEYECDINAATGVITDWDVDSIYD